MNTALKLNQYDFHDGYLTNIQHIGNNIQMTMISAQLDPEVSSDLMLAKDNTLKGKLHLDNITKIKVNKKEYCENLRMFNDDGDIFDFTVENDKVIFQIIWNSFSKKCEEAWSEIEAKNIYWENIPDLTHN